MRNVFETRDPASHELRHSRHSPGAVDVQKSKKANKRVSHLQSDKSDLY